MRGDACDTCLRRAWLLARLAGHLDVKRKAIWALLELGDEPLIEAVAGKSEKLVREEQSGFGARAAVDARRRAQVCGVGLICACHGDYPPALRNLVRPPAVLHVVGGVERFVRLCEQDPAAVVGARKASAYGIEVARSLARALSSAGITVVSGMAAGIDTAAHRGVLEANGSTIAVLAGSASQAYPPANRGLHREIMREGVAVSELPPDTAVRSWMFTARNRLIAALGCATVVVQATPRSGSLLTARASQELGRPVGAVPGPVTSQLSAGPNQLLADGASVIRGAQDVLDLLYGPGSRAVTVELRPRPTDSQLTVLAAIAAGLDTPAALVAADVAGGRCLAELAALELSGWLRRGPGGQLAVIP